MRVYIFKDHEYAQIPEYKTEGAAGCDLTSIEACIIHPGCSAIVDTGLIMEIPAGYEMQIRPRSGLAAREGLTVLNSPGTIDSDYRGRIKVILHNTGSQQVHVHVGDRICQAVLKEAPQAKFIEVTSVSTTERGEGGFGSTGV